MKRFVYKSYSCKIWKGNMKISFIFKMEPENIFFRPKLIIKSVPTFGIKTLNNLIFHVGLMEMISYWKAACSPEIIIEAGYLDKKQIKWWKNLIIKGMGQFFYGNKIDWRAPNFLTITTKRHNYPTAALRRIDIKLNNRYLVPFAGGRDSIVTLEALKKDGREIALFTVNSIAKIQKVVKVSGIKEQIAVERRIDPKLFELNKRGYFSGHTPFTGLLSFISMLCAVIFDYKNIAFSNEKSANEGNLQYLGRTINHQWAKSSEFEKMFRCYSKKYLAKNINYFSYLRKYADLEISKMFVKYPKYFSAFSSCNAAFRIVKNPPLPKLRRARWCGKCPKCLFVYLILYPYLKEKELLKIFGKNLFNDRKLLPIMKSLLGQGSDKPFECVGTYKESGKAFKLSFEKARKSGKIPYLLKEVL